MNEKPTHLDLFSGIGGFALAAQWAGFETIGFSEINKRASAILARHWPGIPNFGDIRTVPEINCDLVTGGFPCQPFSTAGKRRGENDNRYLWPAMLEAIRKCKPTWLVGENVTGIIGMALEQVLTDLEANDYESQAIIIPASGVMAVHERKRVWILAHSNKNKRDRHPHRASSLGKRGDMVSEVQSQGQIRMPELRSTLPRVGRYSYAEARRKFYGIPAGVDRIESLGNAIVPQVAYPILKAIRDLI